MGDLEEKLQSIADYQAEWALDAVATATQDRRFLRGDPKEDVELTEVFYENARIATRTAISEGFAAARRAGFLVRPNE